MTNIDNAVLEKNILQILIENNNKITEFELIRRLQEVDIIEKETDLSNNLSLFQIHFLLFHLLYKLRLKWIKEEKWYLDITSVSLTLFMYSKGSADITEYDPLAEYYLDIGNYDTDENEINQMLDNFWIRYLASEKKNQALLTLGLEEPVDIVTIKKKYRELARIHHPDSGGGEDEIKKINEAMDILSKIY